ncbi:MAG TPA: urease accessory UreF family protein [Candidatus Binatia bacterium]|nr:urease accessory UreF family protein [Candidatus Binatia bacterium]
MRIDVPALGVDGGERGLLLLQAWLSPAFPVGGYAYSHGLEAAVEAGIVRDRADLMRWIDGILRFGAGRNDALLIREAHRQVTAGEDIHELTAFAAAFRGTSELALEAGAQGAAFLKALRAGWPDIASAPQLQEMRTPTYAVCFGAAAALAGIAARWAMLSYLQAFLGNLVSAALRLMPIGQSDGLVALATLSERLPERVDQYALTPFEDIGSATLMVDLMSVRHETQYTRLFRS